MFTIWHQEPKYPSDLTDEQWGLIGPLIPPSPPTGNDRRTSMRAVVNAIFYINRGGSHGGCCPRIIRLGKPFTVILLAGSVMALGKLFTMHCVAWSACGQDARRNHRRGSSIANR